MYGSMETMFVPIGARSGPECIRVEGLPACNGSAHGLLLLTVVSISDNHFPGERSPA